MRRRTLFKRTEYVLIYLTSSGFFIFLQAKREEAEQATRSNGNLSPQQITVRLVCNSAVQPSFWSTKWKILGYVDNNFN